MSKTKEKIPPTIEACAFLLDAILSSDDRARLEWDRKVIQAFDIPPADFLLALRTIVNGR